VPTPLSEAEGNTTNGDHGKPLVDPAQSKTLCMRGNSLRWNREIPQVPAADGAAGRPEKVSDRTTGMYARGKSDGCVVPRKPPNKDGVSPSAEAVEGRRPTKGNTLLSAAPRTQSRSGTSIGR
jgi:RNA-directed DNA polymerase